VPTLEPAVEALSARLGHRFARPELLRQALTHSSKANEAGDLALGNERLEFLGDAVLGLCVAELLMTAFPHETEGALSRARAQAVNQASLAARALDLGLDGVVQLGKSERKNAGREKPSILADVFEAVLGALYLDAGFEAARTFVAREFASDLQEVGAVLRDAKTRLQETLQSSGNEPPRYVTVAESGPPHAREFSVEARVGERVLGAGRGRSKQAAEQAAARYALLELGSDAS
jgi:ribonuclease-3